MEGEWAWMNLVIISLSPTQSLADGFNRHHTSPHVSSACHSCVELLPVAFARMCKAIELEEMAWVK